MFDQARRFLRHPDFFRSLPRYALTIADALSQQEPARHRWKPKKDTNCPRTIIDSVDAGPCKFWVEVHSGRQRINRAGPRIESLFQDKTRNTVETPDHMVASSTDAWNETSGLELE